MERPVGKKITSVDPISGALGFMFQMPKAYDPATIEQNRATALTDKIGDITVDTALPCDTRIWETGIKRMSIEGKWVIVSQYETREEAEVGHRKWVELMQTDPTCKLKDINMWNIPSLEEEINGD